MADGVPRSEDRLQHPITVDIIEICAVTLQKMPIQVRPIEVLANIGSGDKPVGIIGVFLFTALYDVCRIRETTDPACVIGMEMRQRNETYVSGIDTKRAKLCNTAFLFTHDRLEGVDGRSPIGPWISKPLDCKAAIDDRIAFGMNEQKPRDRNFDKSPCALVHPYMMVHAPLSASLKQIESDISH